MFLKTLFISLVLSISTSKADQAIPDGDDKTMYPINLLLLDTQFGHHVIIAEKATHKVHLYKNNNGLPKYVKSFNAATGKRSGNKFSKGDLKTPEGIYTLNKFISKDELVKKWGDEGLIYGAGAFASNYPNDIDRLNGKTGGGIWLHSTNDNSRINKGLDSRGCVVVVDEDLKELSKYIELKKTTLLIVQNLLFAPKNQWLSYRENILNKIENWRKSWENESIENYIKHYSNNRFFSYRHQSLGEFRTYKSNVFSMQGSPQVTLSDMSILKYGNYAVVTFKQSYKSEKINDEGKKTLYLEMNKDYDWKIVSETWNKMDDSIDGTKVAFTPSLRFFNE